eukprot:GSChrysophyteH1.ASY1.ANO1.2165.1 assembled CDS
MATFNDKEGPVIGIDLGTTYSCLTTPSWVAFSSSGRVVGQPAKAQASMNAANTIYDTKRVPYSIRMSPEEVSSMVIGELKAAAEADLGTPVKRAVITVPAHFNDQQRQATKDAGRIAGLEVARIINEPTAAALAYGLHSAGSAGAAALDKSNVLIFDLGGGTFDVSILSMEGGVFSVKATGGDTHLGGEDFDNALIETGSPPPRISRPPARLSSVFARNLSFASPSSLVVSTLSVLSSKMPQLSGLFSNRIELCKSINPDEAVAYGAAVQGAIIKSGGTGGGVALDGISSDLVLLDVTPLSLGIELEGRVMSVLIPRNTPIPCVKSREYTTCEDWQTEIDVVVFEGERPQTSANNKLGEFKISGVQRAKRGEPKVEVTFSLDSNGILAVTAMDKADRGRLTDSDIERMIADAERYREEDLALARKIHLKNALEESVYSVKSNLTERNDIAGISDLDEILTWLEYDSESASHQELQKKADQLFSRFGVKVDATSRAQN